MRVVFTALAQRQLVRLHAEISRRSGYESRADAYIQRIQSDCLKLENFPERGTVRNDIWPGLRTVGFERRVTIAFIVRGETVEIHAILYGGQDIASAFANNPQQ